MFKIVSCQATELTTANGETLNKIYFEHANRTFTAYVSETHTYFGNDVRDYIADQIGADYWEAVDFCAEADAPYTFMHDAETLEKMLEHFLGTGSATLEIFKLFLFVSLDLVRAEVTGVGIDWGELGRPEPNTDFDLTLPGLECLDRDIDNNFDLDSIDVGTFDLVPLGIKLD